MATMIRKLILTKSDLKLLLNNYAKIVHGFSKPTTEMCEDGQTMADSYTNGYTFEISDSIDSTLTTLGLEKDIRKMSDLGRKLDPDL